MKTLKLLSLLLTITLFGCTEENNYFTTTAEGLGKTNVYIEGDITNEEVAEKLANEVGSITENIYIGSALRPLNNVTTLELDIPTNVRNIDFSGFYDNLKTIKIKGHGAMPESNLKLYSGIKTENILVEGITELFDVILSCSSELQQTATIICNDLTYVHRNFQAGGGVSAQIGGGFKPVNFICNDLKYINPNSIYSGSSIGVFGVFNTLSMNSLKKIAGFNFRIGGGGLVSDVILPSLEEAGSISITQMTTNHTQGINSISLPLLTELSEIYITDNYILSVNFPALIECENIYLKDQVLPRNIINMPFLNYCTYYASNMQFTSTGVNTILNKFLTIQPTSGKTIDLTQETVPTGQGLIDKQTLITQGNQVWTN